METALTTNFREPLPGACIRYPLIWKAWIESRVRFLSGLALLVTLVFYAVLTSNGYIARHNAAFTYDPLRYTVYIWSGLFNFALQGLWILSVLILTPGGMARERDNGVAFFMLGLPASRARVFLTRAGTVATEAMLLAIVPAMLIPVLSTWVGQSYSPAQALLFGLSMGVTGMIFLGLGLFLSEILTGEYTASVVGLCSVGGLFFAFKDQNLHRWSIFDIMSRASSIDPQTQLLPHFGHWIGMVVCLMLTACFLGASLAVVRVREF
jgi:ABC-2 type transport system permease protein